MWSGKGEGFCGEVIEKICGGMKGLNAVGRQKACLEKERMHYIVGGTNNTFSFAILLGCVGQDMRRVTPLMRKKVRAVELSNSRPLSH